MGRLSSFSWRLGALGALIAIGVLALAPRARGGQQNAKEELFSFSRLARDSCKIAADFIQVGPPSVSCSGLDALVQRARTAILGAASAQETLDRLNHFFFEDEGFQPTYDLDSPDHLLLDRVLTGKKGHCVGLATVYLVLAEELGLPIHAVATPKHIFLRWDDGKFRRNIELFQKGRDVPDADYIREQRIPEESIRRGVFMVDLSRKEFLGFIYQNLGVLESQKGDFDASGRLYAKALHLNGKLEAAYYNRGNDELKQKKYREAIRDYTKALKLYPTDAWALKNRGLAWKELRETAKAEEDWKRAKEMEPGIEVPEYLRRPESP